MEKNEFLVKRVRFKSETPCLNYSDLKTQISKLENQIVELKEQLYNSEMLIKDLSEINSKNEKELKVKNHALKNVNFSDLLQDHE